MRVRGTQIHNPSGIEVNKDTVYIRSDVIYIDDDNFRGWEYDEIRFKKDDFIKEIADKSEQLELTTTLTSMETFNALSLLSESNEVNQAQMMMEVMLMISQLQGGE